MSLVERMMFAHNAREGWTLKYPASYPWRAIWHKPVQCSDAWPAGYAVWLA